MADPILLARQGSECFLRRRQGRRAQAAACWGGLKDVLFGSTGPRGGKDEGLAEVAARSVILTVGSSAGGEIVRGVLGGILGSKAKR